MHSRRKFLRRLGGTSALLAGGTTLVGAETFSPSKTTYREHLIEIVQPRSIADTINIGLIGAGIIGHYDLDCALKVPGTKVVAVADLYAPRLVRAKEVWGQDLFTTHDYREVLARKDVDAVLICVPDHWHDHISIAALKAGKHVYCEKPMVHHIEEGQAVIAAHKKSGKVFQVGSQRASASAVLEAKRRYEAGHIGELTSVETFLDRTDALGAWQYTMPPNLDPKDLDWDRYLGDAPKHPFQAERFFRWRNYKDYGTGVAGDLFVHLITGVHTITGSLGPTRIFALGDLNFWKDGRDAYDLVTAMMDYPKTDKHPSFQFTTRVNLATGAGGDIHTRLVGTEGVIDIGWNSFVMNRLKRPNAPMYSRGYDALFTYPQAMQEEFIRQYEQKYPAGQFTRTVQNEPVVTYTAPDGYDDRLDHMIVFFNAIRENNPSLVREDAEFGLRAAAPSLAANLSAAQRKVIHWDPVAMRISKAT
ncbi:MULTISPECIES: Gfo/Idh/MocA family oxidoreductase [unclassified Spirosoma]|uniref:Gfo/Idh/MocA family protein n=1 Tax=unclassified Spirosoma TaxID=2621999 RepID=UPI0009624B9D|nr:MULTISPECIES: Gfo/Idh/MocA family oxidoreductase [unclassified Spirosoma]MBN8825450.1 Gfo/Idh/MocA family oxidoreductase [Spirosoma sp.]OJW74960.1 MAG: oxidoreductase [Spirosoma sp. 48-14]